MCERTIIMDSSKTLEGKILSNPDRFANFTTANVSRYTVFVKSSLILVF